MTSDEKILKKLEEHDGRFDAQDKAIDLLEKKMLEHDERFDKQDGRFDRQDEQFDKQERAIDVLAKKALEHDARFDGLSKEISDFKNQVFEAQDEMLTILRRLDEESASTSHAVVRHDKRITKIEEVLHLT